MIAVLSDSHVPNRAPEIPENFLEKADRAGVVVHCGDFETEQVYKSLDQRLGEFHGVKGNCDRFELQNSAIFDYSGFRFGVYHGTGIHPRGDHETLFDIARNKLEVDILFHGHTHQEEIFREENTLLLNPGSCTGVPGGSSMSDKPTMMTVSLEDGIEVAIIEKKGEQVLRRKERVFKNLK